MEISLRTLHKTLREYGLRRRNTESDDGEIFQAGCIRGYIHTYIHILLAQPMGLFRVNFTLLKKAKYITIIKEDKGQ